MVGYFQEQVTLVRRLVDAADRRDAGAYTALGKEQPRLARAGGHVPQGVRVQGVRGRQRLTIPAEEPSG